MDGDGVCDSSGVQAGSVDDDVASELEEVIVVTLTEERRRVLLDHAAHDSSAYPRSESFARRRDERVARMAP